MQIIKLFNIHTLKSFVNTSDNNTSQEPTFNQKNVDIVNNIITLINNCYWIYLFKLITAQCKFIYVRTLIFIIKL